MNIPQKYNGLLLFIGNAIAFVVFAFVAGLFIRLTLFFAGL